MRRSSLLLAFLAALMASCTGSFFQVTPPSNPGVPAAPADVVALAGPDLIVLEGARTALAGDASRALAGEPELSWSQREGPPVVLSNPSAAQPTFIAPLAPARLVFVLSARADQSVDFDEVTVDVVADSAALVAAPSLLAVPADITAIVAEPTVVTTTWTGVGAPRVVARCDSDAFTSALDGDTLTISLVPSSLPCPIVIDDIVDAASSAGRAALILWPVGQALASATRVIAPAVAEPGALIELDVDKDARVFFVDGNAIAIERTVVAGLGRATFAAPLRPARLSLLVDNRPDSGGADGTSGGPRLVAIETSAGTRFNGASNSAPTVDAGPDLRVRPGARFRIDPRASDDDGDDTVTTLRQVLGSAVRQGGGIAVQIAPSVNGEETLLFHVVSFDGTAESAIDTVRVVVDPAADNLPPVIQLPPELYTRPGAEFTIDASRATDPDAGIIASWTIAQDEDDDVILIDDAHHEPLLQLTAGAAGERYRFLVSVVDDGGLEASTSITVIVEQAGPYVDVARGTVDGDGTALRPFVSVQAATAVAARHRFPAIIVATSAVPLSVGALPDGIGLRGGVIFDGDSYVDDDSTTPLRISGALTLSGVDIARLALTADAGAVLSLQRRVIVDDCVVDVPVTVEASGRVVFNNSTLHKGLTSRGTVDLNGRTEVRAAESVAVAAEAGLLRLLGDARIRVTASLIGARTGSRVTGLRVSGTAIAALAGAIVVEADDRAVGVVVAGGTVELQGAAITAGGAQAVGIDVVGGALSGQAVISVIADGQATALLASAPFGGVISGRLNAQGAPAIGASVLAGVFDKVRVTATGVDAIGLIAQTAQVTSSLINSDGAGVVVSGGTLQHVTVHGDDIGVIADGARGLLALKNALVTSPAGIAADDGVSLDETFALFVVGFVEPFDVDPLDCVACVVGPAAAVDADLGLAFDADLGFANPFVDAGDAADAVAFDVDGRPIAAASADLGGLERAP